MVTLQACSVVEAVNRYNVTPKDGSDPAIAPINEVFRHPGRDVDVTSRGGTNEREQFDALSLKPPGVYIPGGGQGVGSAAGRQIFCEVGRGNCDRRRVGSNN